jgi:TonB family protein
MLLAFLLAGAGQESEASPKPSEESPCHWSEEYVDWLTQLQPSVDQGRSELATPPIKLRDVPPEYPRDTLQRRSLGGRSVVEAVIDDKGKILDARLIERIMWDPAWPEFDNAILDAVRQWEFEPTTVGGTTMWVCMTTSIAINWGSDLQSKEKSENTKPRGRRTMGSSRRTAGWIQ